MFFTTQKCTQWFTLSAFCLSFSDDVCSALHGFLYGEWWLHYKFCAFQASAPRLFSAAVQRSLLLTAGSRPFPPPLFFPSCMTLFCLGPQVNPAIFCPLVHASHINLESIKSRCALTCYKNISVCVLHQGFSIWLACIPALMNPRKDCWISKTHIMDHLWLLTICCLSISISVSVNHRCASCRQLWAERHPLHVWSACSAATAAACRASQHLSSPLYSLTPGKMPPPAYPSHGPRHFQ